MKNPFQLDEKINKLAKTKQNKLSFKKYQIKLKKLQKILIFFLLINILIEKTNQNKSNSVSSNITKNNKKTNIQKLQTTLKPKNLLELKTRKSGRSKKTAKTHCIVDPLQSTQIIKSINQTLKHHDHYLDFILICNSFLIDLWVLYSIILWMFTGKSPILMQALLIFYLLRASGLAMGHWPFPDNYLFKFPGLTSLFIPYNKTNDFYFSGHTGLLTILCLNYWKLSANKKNHKKKNKKLNKQSENQKNLSQKQEIKRFKNNQKILFKSDMESISQISDHNYENSSNTFRGSIASKNVSQKNIKITQEFSHKNSMILEKKFSNLRFQTIPSEYAETPKFNNSFSVKTNNDLKNVNYQKTSKDIPNQNNPKKSQRMKESNNLENFEFDSSFGNKTGVTSDKENSTQVIFPNESGLATKQSLIESLKIQSPVQYNYSPNPKQQPKSLVLSECSIHTQNYIKPNQSITTHQKDENLNIILQKLYLIINWWFRIFSLGMLFFTVFLLLVTSAHFTNDILIGFCAAIVSFKTGELLKNDLELLILRILGFLVYKIMKLEKFKKEFFKKRIDEDSDDKEILLKK